MPAVQTITREQCQQWVSDPLKNPISKRTIKKDGPTYTDIKHACMGKWGIGLGIGPVPTNVQELPPTTKIQSPTNGPDARNANVIIRRCPHLAFKKVKPPALTPRRNYVLEPAPEEGLRETLRHVYDILSICQAPGHVNISYKTTFQDQGFKFYQILTETVHLAHGETIIPGEWMVPRTAATLTLRNSSRLVKAKPGDILHNITDFTQVVKFAKQTKKPHCMLVSTPHSKDMVKGYHAVMLILYTTLKPTRQRGKLMGWIKPNNECLNVAIIDPMTNLAEPGFVNHIMKYLKRQAKSLDFKIQGTLLDDSIEGRYQSANSQLEHSSMDPIGYCAMWTCMMMDNFGRNVASGLQIMDTSTVVQAVSLPIELPQDPPKIWRRLIMDYTFSRAVWAYAIFSSQSGTPKDKDLIENFLNPYINVAGSNMAGILNDMKSYRTDTKSATF